MDLNWLIKLDKTSAIIVPTRSLANTLNEQVAAHHISQGRRVWEAPNILIWGDYLKELWQLNKAELNQKIGARHVISAQQSMLLWTQIIESARREEQALALLNVQQTARAVQRSWVLMHDWQIEIDALAQDHVADTVQFILWLKAYKQLLADRGLLDESLLLDALCNTDLTLQFPYKKLVFYAFDLINASQKGINDRSESAMPPVAIEHRSPMQSEGGLNFVTYKDSDAELTGCMQAAREMVEANPQATINIVVHDLQDRQAQVQKIANDVFYPSASPLDVQQNSTVYRYSLGQRLNEWAAIETALNVIGLLKNRITTSDFSFLLRNQFLGLCAAHRSECRTFDRWLKQQRMRHIMLDQLPEMYQKCLNDLNKRSDEPTQEAQSSGLLAALINLVEKRQVVVEQLAHAKQVNNFAAISFSDWVDVFSHWLASWGWSTKTVGNDLNTVQHQLLNRWESLLQEFAALATVQRQTGIVKAIDLLQQMARDAMFLPKAAASPILISSILEAVGRPADMCFVLGMNDAYPPAPKNDAFIPQRLLASAGHPDMSPDSSFLQAEKVMSNLLSSVGETVVSFAFQSDLDQDIIQHCSPLFRDKTFSASCSKTQKAVTQIELESYQDGQGPAWQDAATARGGSKIFENQSHCAFKAFVTHQLRFQTEQEAEFGLDFLDRGNIVHHLLDLIWERLKTQRRLKELSQSELSTLIHHTIDSTLDSSVSEVKLGLSEDKRALLKLERPRLVSLLRDWLNYEMRRPEPFTVIEREERRTGWLSGIEFTYIIDRVDSTDDGRMFIIDYKTGTVNKKDWVGEPLKSPQMPLYAVTLSKLKKKDVSGIAYANIRQHEHKYVELSEAGVFQKESSRTLVDEELWKENSADWERVFDELANDFLSGKAEVKPIDESTCTYCDLHSVCRISQLQKQTTTSEEPLVNQEPSAQQEPLAKQKLSAEKKPLTQQKPSTIKKQDSATDAVAKLKEESFVQGDLF